MTGLPRADVKREELVKAAAVWLTSRTQQIITGVPSDDQQFVIIVIDGVREPAEVIGVSDSPSDETGELRLEVLIVYCALPGASKRYVAYL